MGLLFIDYSTRGNWHVDDSTKGGYYMILGRYLLTALGLNLKLSNHLIESYDGPFKGYTAPMVDLGTKKFKDTKRHL